MQKTAQKKTQKTLKELTKYQQLRCSAEKKRKEKKRTKPQ
jgi:hypothetical protein